MITIYDPKTHTITRREETPEEIAERERARVEHEKTHRYHPTTEERVADIEAALVELAELYAAQDDALVELAALIEEG